MLNPNGVLQPVAPRLVIARTCAYKAYGEPVNQGSAMSTAVAGTRIVEIFEESSESVDELVGVEPLELDDDDDELELDDDDVDDPEVIDTPPVAAPTVVVRHAGLAPTLYDTLLQISVFCVKLLLVPSSNS